MIFKPRFLIGSLLAVLFAGALCSAQTTQPPTSSTPPIPVRDDGETTEDLPKSFRELMIKRRLAQRKKEHDAMLKRGDEALKISDELQESYLENGRLSTKDRQLLSDLEKLVTRIRNDLGGSEAKGENEKIADSPKSIDEAFAYLKQSTESLVAELNRTTRFSISAVAIETSNSVIKLARFLRLRR